jgi:hypothetical protein
VSVDGSRLRRVTDFVYDEKATTATHAKSNAVQQRSGRRGDGSGDGSAHVLGTLSSSALRGDGSDLSNDLTEGYLLHKSIGNVWPCYFIIV